MLVHKGTGRYVPSGLRSEAERLRSELTGTLRLGPIPTALPVVSSVTTPFLKKYPAVDVEIRSLSSREIARRLEGHELDVGLTYLDNEPVDETLAVPVYHERYRFVTSRRCKPRGATSITWAEAAEHSLCLLTPDMQNRRIVDSAFTTAGSSPRPRVEADSVSALLSHALSGWSCVVAHTWLALHGLPRGIRAFQLTDPEGVHLIGLVSRPRRIEGPLISAFRDHVAGLDIDSQLQTP